MADTKTSAELSASTLTGTELIRVVQGGADRKTTLSAIVTDLGLGGGTIADGSITNAKLATMPTNTVIGNATGSTGAAQYLTLAGGLSMDGTSKIKSKGSFAFVYTWSTDTTETDPGANGAKGNNATFGSVTELYIDPTASGSRNIAKLIENSSQIGYISNNESGTAMGIFNISGIANNADNFYSIAGSFLAGFGSLPANGEEILLVFQPTITGGLVVQNLLDLNFLREDANGDIVNGSGTVISGELTATTVAAMPAASTISGKTYVVTNPGNNTNPIPWAVRSNGTRLDIVGGDAEIINEVPMRTITCPAATFTSATATSINSGTDIRLTSAGAHGLVSATNVGMKIYVSGGTNWPVGFYTIKTIATDTTGLVIDLEEPFVSGMGVPTISLVTTEIPGFVWHLPPMSTRGGASVEFTADDNPLGASTASKTVKVRHTTLGGAANSGTALWSNAETTNAPIQRALIGFQNNGSVSVQEGFHHVGSTSGVGNVNSGVTVTGAIDTSSSTDMMVTVTLASAGDSVTIKRLKGRCTI